MPGPRLQTLLPPRWTPGYSFITASCLPEIWSYPTAFLGWAPLGSRWACLP